MQSAGRKAQQIQFLNSSTGIHNQFHAANFASLNALLQISPHGKIHQEVYFKSNVFQIRVVTHKFSTDQLLRNKVKSCEVEFNIQSKVCSTLSSATLNLLACIRYTNLRKVSLTNTMERLISFTVATLHGHRDVLLQWMQLALRFTDKF